MSYGPVSIEEFAASRGISVESIRNKAATGSGLSEGTGSSCFNFREKACLKGHQGSVLVAKFTPNGNYLFSGGRDRTVRLWNPRTGLLVKTYAGHGYEVRGVASSADDTRFVSCGGDRSIFYWDVASGSFLRKFKGHDAVVNAVAFSGPADDVVISAGYDNCVKIWDCRSRSVDPIQVIRGFKDSVSSLACHDHAIVAGSIDGTVRRFDVRAGVASKDTLGLPVTSVALTRDGACVLAACVGSVLAFLDVASGQLLATFHGHVQEEVRLDCGLLPSDSHAVGCSETGEVLLWDLLAEERAPPVCRFDAHPGTPVTAMHVNPTQSAYLVTASVDGSIKTWDGAGGNGGHGAPTNADL